MMFMRIKNICKFMFHSLLMVFVKKIMHLKVFKVNQWHSAVASLSAFGL